MPTQPPSVEASALRAAQAATQRIAPVWPLDKSVAVNPCWHWRHLPMAQAAALLGGLRAMQLLMPGDYYRALFPQQITAEALRLAAAEHNLSLEPAALVAALGQQHTGPQWKNCSDWLDEQPAQANKMPWRAEITQQISQACGLFFSYPEHQACALETPGTFYRFWRDMVSQDAGIAILMAAPDLQRYIQQLPTSPRALISAVYGQLQQLTALSEAAFSHYCLALLLDINGWAAVFARAEQAFDEPAADGLGCLGDLLAARLAWESVLLHWMAHQSALKPLPKRFAEQFHAIEQRTQVIAEQQRQLWVWQRALELSVQGDFARRLRTPQPHAHDADGVPTLQAVFCIDVRSEPMRRALEAVAPDIQTLGFAGFFGLPMAYQPFSCDFNRPQLPALLKPSLSARPLRPAAQQQRILAPLLRQQCQTHSSDQAAATFGWVEAKGIFAGLRLLAQSFGYGHLSDPLHQLDAISGWQLWRDGEPLPPAALAELAAGVLRHMGLTGNFAARVLLVAHGSCSANNPLAASLDCGACGGQSGEVNVRVLAYLLNQPEVRAALSGLGIDIPAACRFIACLHNTTTDELTWLASPARALDEAAPAAWQAWLQQAGERARAQRAASLAITTSDPQRRQQAFKARSRDWAQLRPEWGLANNAAFIVAPRAASRHIDLAGRAFLHDYQWQADDGFATLELIMTAPMVVTQWINLQYYASTTDNLHFGSGNKLLHNVVGGNLGVFEGNGGDLRIGLPLQSLHDGTSWRHQPVRLSVFIAAPCQAIATIIERHPTLADLINHDWLYLLQWDPATGDFKRYYQGQWRPEALTQAPALMQTPAEAAPCTA